MHDAVTLLGAHTMGHVHPEVSGVGRAGRAESKSPEDPLLFNAWNDRPDQFDNSFFVFLLGGVWKNSRSVHKEQQKNTWLDDGKQFIMMTSDMTLGFHPTLNDGFGRAGEQCGSRAVGEPGDGEHGCVVERTNDDGEVEQTVTSLGGPGPLLERAKKFAADNELFLRKFSKAFARMSTVGFGGPSQHMFRKAFNTSTKLGVLVQANVDTEACR